MGGQSHSAEPITRGYTKDAHVSFDGGRFSGGGSYVTLLDEGGRTIAFVVGEYVPGELDAVMDANASLYAAAPEPLKIAHLALLSLDEDIEAQRQANLEDGIRDDTDPGLLTFISRRDLIAATISKATGGAA